MKNTYLLATLLFTISFFSQTTILTTLTLTHEEVRGSKISMIPPKDFQVAKSFMGFQQAETNSSVMVLDVPGPFLEVSKALTVENLLKQGVEVENSEQIILNGLPAVLIKGDQTAYGSIFRKYILVLGTEQETIMINGIVPKDSLALGDAVKNALLSTVYDVNKILTPLDAVDFQISTVETDFIFAKSMSNMLVYNRDGKIPVETSDKASLVIAKAFSKVAITDKKMYATNRIKTLPVQISKIIKTIAVEINGLKGYEITAEGVNRKTGIKEQAYQVMLFTDDSYYILFGSSQDDFDTNLVVFKKLVQTFQLK